MKSTWIVWYENPRPAGNPRDGAAWKEYFIGDQEGYLKSLLVADLNRDSARMADLDADGDLDIISIAWRNFQYLHARRNDAIQKQL